MFQTSNIDEIDLIPFIPNVIKRRIKRECREMRNIYDEIIIEYKSSKDISVSFKKNHNYYEFIIPSNYPFMSPRLTINGLNQNEFFDLKTNRLRTILKYISGLTCLCCHSYLCKNNWSPALTLQIIINQIEEYKKIKKNIFLKILADKIKDKYLISDIDLDSWLFNVSLPHLSRLGSQYH
jgi:hypothetical protein